MRSLQKWMATISVICLLSGCFIPDEFALEVSVPTASEAGWNFSGKWQFFFAGYDPRRDPIPPKELIGLTSELGKLPGSTSVAHVGKNVWKQTISWRVRLRDAQDRPTTVQFPTSTPPSGGPDFWLVRFRPESGNSVLIETAEPPNGPDLGSLLSMGYKSSGSFSLKTSGTVEQISGPPLSKSWFSGTYSATWNLFQGPPIRVRVKW